MTPKPWPCRGFGAHLWRTVKQKVRANRQDVTIDRRVARAFRSLRRRRVTLRKAGARSRRFWLRGAQPK